MVAQTTRNEIDLASRWHPRKTASVAECSPGVPKVSVTERCVRESGTLPISVSTSVWDSMFDGTTHVSVAGSPPFGSAGEIRKSSMSTGSVSQPGMGRCANGSPLPPSTWTASASTAPDPTRTSTREPGATEPGDEPARRWGGVTPPRNQSSRLPRRDSAGPRVYAVCAVSAPDSSLRASVPSAPVGPAKSDRDVLVPGPAATWDSPVRPPRPASASRPSGYETAASCAA